MMHNYLKFPLIFIACIVYILLIIKSLAIISHTCLLDSDNCNTISLYESFCILTGLVTLYIAYIEYQLHKERQMADTLSEYNKRYSENETFKGIIIELIRHEDDEIGNDDILKGTEDAQIVYNRELFMRFFEELQIQIEKGNLERSLVHELFGWYAKKVEQLGENFVSDYEKDCWTTFKCFVKDN